MICRLSTRSRRWAERAPSGWFDLQAGCSPPHLEPPQRSRASAGAKRCQMLCDGSCANHARLWLHWGKTGGRAAQKQLDREGSTAYAAECWTHRAACTAWWLLARPMPQLGRVHSSFRGGDWTAEQGSVCLCRGPHRCDVISSKQAEAELDSVRARLCPGLWALVGAQVWENPECTGILELGGTYLRGVSFRPCW